MPALPTLRALVRDRRSRVAVLVLVTGLAAVLAWRYWDMPRSLAVEVRDRIGLQLVESHAGRIEAAARESEVDPTLIAGVMFAESRGRGGQRSSAGAYGLMQLVPAAAGDAAMRLGVPEPTVDELRDDDDLNVRLGAAHLAWLLEHRGDWTLEQVLVSYNAGRAKLFRWIEREGSYAAWRRRELAREAAGGSPADGGPTGALRYALQVLEARRRLVERGVVRPIDGIETVK